MEFDPGSFHIGALIILAIFNRTAISVVGYPEYIQHRIAFAYLEIFCQLTAGPNCPEFFIHIAQSNARFIPQHRIEGMFLQMFFLKIDVGHPLLHQKGTLKTSAYLIDISQPFNQHHRSAQLDLQVTGQADIGRDLLDGNNLGVGVRFSRNNVGTETRRRR